MPALLAQIQPQIIGVNDQEMTNQIAMVTAPHLKIPFDFTTADAAVLLTVPTLGNGAAAIQIESLWWEITTGFTGGASSTIGISSTNTKYNSKGDLLGGVAGDTATTLVATNKYVMGTAGTKFAVAVSTGKVFLVAGDVLRFDRITSAFTAGAGFLHANVRFLD